MGLEIVCQIVQISLHEGVDIMSQSILRREDVISHVTNHPPPNWGGQKIPGRIIQLSECHSSKLSQQIVCWMDKQCGSNCCVVGVGWIINGTVFTSGTHPCHNAQVACLGQEKKRICMQCNARCKQKRRLLNLIGVEVARFAVLDSAQAESREPAKPASSSPIVQDMLPDFPASPSLSCVPTVLAPGQSIRIETTFHLYNM